MHAISNKSSSTKASSRATTWTLSHDAYCLTYSLTPSAKLLWQWFVKMGEGLELEADLQLEFNNWVTKKRGKPYDPKTLKSAIAQLNDNSIIKIVRRYSWKIYKLFLRPLDWLTPKKKSQDQGEISAFHGSNRTTAESEVNNNNNIVIDDEIIEEAEKVLTVCEENGIVFNPVKSPEILDYSLENVNMAIECFIAAGGHEVDRFGRRKIRNPQGWLLKCLRYGYWEKTDSWSFYSLLSAFGMSDESIEAMRSRFTRK